MPALLLLSVLLPPTAVFRARNPRTAMKMKQSEVRELFSKSSIPLTEIDPQHLSAPPVGCSGGCARGKLSFEGDELRKITVLLKCPIISPPPQI
jgi:hypothetical protein